MIRPVCAADAETLYRWRASPPAVGVSVSAPPTKAEHARWMADRLRHGSWWMAEAEGTPVGVVRVDSGWVSIMVEAAQQRRGVGRQLLAALPPGVYRARVASTNTASQALFESAGYRQVSHEATWTIWLRDGLNDS